MYCARLARAAGNHQIHDARGGSGCFDGVEGYIRSSYEIEAEEFVVEGAANLPLSDTFALRVAAKYTDSQGFIKDEGVGHKVPATEDVIGRISALWVPNDQLSAELKYTRSEMDANSGLDVQITNCEPFIPPGFQGGPQGGIGQLNCIQADGQPVEDELDYRRNNDLVGARELEMDMALLDVDYQIGEYTLNSLTAFYQFENYFLLDLELTSVPSLVAPSRFATDQVDAAEHFSQELRLTSPSGNRFEWMAGLYYREEEVDYINAVLTGFSPPIPPFAPPALAIAAAPTTQKSETLSAFGTLQFNVTDRLRATVGLRYIEVELNARLSEQVTLLGSFTYLDSEFRDFPNAACYTRQSPAQGCVDGVQDLSGHVTTFAPEYAGSLSLIYEQPVGDFFLTIEPNVFFTDGYAIISDFNPRNAQDGFTKVNLRVALAPATDQWEVALVGCNLNDKLTTHFCQEVPAVQTPNTVACSADPPATCAIQARYNF